MGHYAQLLRMGSPSLITVKTPFTNGLVVLEYLPVKSEMGYGGQMPFVNSYIHIYAVECTHISNGQSDTSKCKIRRRNQLPFGTDNLSC